MRRRARITTAVAGLFAVLAVIFSAPAATAVGPAPVTVTGVDLHDGQITKWGSTYYWYGSMYGCGFTWYQSPTPWCGFGVSTAPALEGPWTTPRPLFPANAPDPYNPGKTYQQTCGSTGQGCFTPRMIQRTGWGANDGVFILWWNAPWYLSGGGAPHAYMAMGCNGPAGPCGATAGAPYGTTHRPQLNQCKGANGDAGLLPADGTNPPALVCPMAGNTGVGIERLTYWGADGAGQGSTSVAGLQGIEGVGGWRDPSGTWVLTFSDPGCGYCTGSPAGYATAPSQLGPWSAPQNIGAGANANGRRVWSAATCGGQADGVSVMDGVPWQKVNLWRGTPNETTAGQHLEALTFRPAFGSTGDGGLWRPAMAPLVCE